MDSSTRPLLSALRRSRWIIWIQFMTFLGWTVSAPRLNAVYEPTSGFDWAQSWTWNPQWQTNDPVNDPEPPDGADWSDVDTDGLPAWVEEWYGILHACPMHMAGNPDCDGDGATDGEELQVMGTDPLNMYSCGVNRPDGTPINDLEWWTLSITDSDSDGLYDITEICTWQTDPANPDSDGDGWPDSAEATHGAGLTPDPSSPTNPDSDNDGLSDLVDDLLTHHPLGDNDGDGLKNQAEHFSHGTSMLRSDTDEDGLGDGYELKTLSQLGESKAASDPTNPDSDGDGISDGEDEDCWFPTEWAHRNWTQPMEITGPGTLPSGTAGELYTSPEFTAVGNDGNCRWELVPGSDLDGNMAFTGSYLTGTMGAGVYNFTARVTDDSGYTAERLFQFVIRPGTDPLGFTTPTWIGSYTLGASWEYQFDATGGDGAATFAAPDGLPEQMILEASGRLHGSINTEGSFDFTVTATDAIGAKATQVFTVSITPPDQLAIVTAELGDVHPGENSSMQIEAQGGTGACQWSFVEAQLPSGLSFSSSGRVLTIHGTPDTAVQFGSYEIHVEITDAAGQTAAAVYFLNVTDPPPPEITLTGPTGLDLSLFTKESVSFQATGGAGAYSWQVLNNGDLPGTVEINPITGTFSVVAEAAGAWPVVVAATDGVLTNEWTIWVAAADRDADGDGLLASKEHELALAWNLPLHDGEAYSSRGNAAEGAHDWLYYYYSELVYNDLWSDTDEDGLGSQLEQFLGTNPDLKDSDGDFRPDWWQRYQAFNRFHLIRDGYGEVIDQDGDGLPFSLEILIGSNDGSLDSDGDGLGDEWEWVNASYSDINLSDTDADGLSDMEEYNAGTYARMADSDGDFLTDREELQGLFCITLNPLDQDSDDDGLPDWTEVDLTDSDGAGIPDLLEEFWGLDKIDPLDEHGDLDGDVLHGGFTNLQAYQHGWDVRARFDPLFDRDGDGMTNNYELARGLEPDDKTDGADDADADFLTNAEEYKHRTSHTLLLTPARAHEGDLDSPLKKVNAPDVWGHYAFRDVQNDFEVAFGSALPSNLLRDNGPHSGRQHDDDWDQDGMSNFQELYPPSGPPSNPRSYDAPLEITRPPDKVEPGGAYDTVLMASGGITPYQFRVKEGNQLPAWLTLIGARLAGTAPSAPITEPSFSLVCRDTRGSEVEMAVSVRVAPPPPPFSWQTPADLGYVDVTSGSVSYSTVLSTAHGNGSVSFTAENLPAGCTLSSTGEFVGTFANGETTAVSFSVTATDQASPPESIVRTFTLALRPVVETLAVTPFTPPIVIPGAAYGPITVTTTGGQGAVVVSVVGQLPPGFAFDGSSFSGTAPAYLDPFTVTFRASDSQDPPQEAFYTASFTVPSIPGVPTLLGPPMITGGEPCNFRLQVIGGGWQEPYSLTLLSGELPPGLTYNAATHTLSGTTTAYDWSSNLVFWAAGVGPPVELPWTLKTSQRPVGPLKISGVNEISVVRGTFVYRTFRAYDGFRPWQYVLPPAASLPVGISSRSGMEWDGLKAYLVGTPSELTAGWQPITISAVDDQGRRVDHVVNFRVLPPVEISDNLTVVKPGSPVSMHLAASGGSGGYIWQVGTGGLPAGLTLNASGTLTGTPSAPGVSYFTLHAQDNEGNRVSRDFALESAPAASGGSPPPPSFQLQAHSQSVTFSYDSGGEKSEVREIIGTGAAAKMQLLMDGWNEFDDGDSDPETWLLKKTVTVDISPSGYYKYQATGEGSKDIKTSEQVVDIIKNGGDRPTLDDSMKETGSFKDSGFINASGNLIATSGSSRGFPIAQWYDFRMKASDPVQADTPFTFLKVTPPPPGSPVTASPTIKSITITIPKGGTVSTKGGDKAGLISLHPYGGSRQHLLPIEVVELSPKVRDEDNNEIAGSEKPNSGKPLPPFVEVDPKTNKIAHREIKVRIGDAMKDKKVTWTLEALPGATPATIRGQWEDSPTHKDRFEASTAYGANGFRKVSQSSGETTVGADGHTAIRVNVPPIGFNQVRIKIQIEGMSTPMDLIDMEVPGAVVIDPGHGGAESGPELFGSSWNNATSPSGVLEKTMALNYGLAVRDALRAKRQQDKLNLRVFMTRDTDVGVRGDDRAFKARDNGADVIFIIHFNSLDDGPNAHRARGTLEVVRNTNNVHPEEDTTLSNTIISRMVTAMDGYDTGANHRGPVVNNTAVASDAYNGNTTNYHPVRTCYCEVEFIDFGANTAVQTDDLVDILLNTGPNAGAVKTAVANAIRDGILQDLRDQPQE